VDAQESVGEDPALEEPSKLPLDESWNVAVAIAGPSQERL
jgi:hypothetical protein